MIINEHLKTWKVNIHWSHISFFLIFGEIKREHKQGRGAEGERESQADCMLSLEPDAGFDPKTLGS